MATCSWIQGHETLLAMGLDSPPRYPAVLLLVTASALPSSGIDTPSPNAARSISSSETDAWPHSIFATRDWLDPMRSASSFWVRRARLRRA